MSKTFVLAHLPHNETSLKVIELLQSLNIKFNVSEDIQFLQGLLNGDASTTQSENIFESKIGEEERLILKELSIDGNHNPVKQEVTTETVQPKGRAFSFDIIVKEEHIVNKGGVMKVPKEEPIGEEEEPLDALVDVMTTANEVDTGSQYAVAIFDSIEHDFPVNEEIAEDAENTDEEHKNNSALRQIDTDSVERMNTDLPVDQEAQDSEKAKDSDNNENSVLQIGKGSDKSDKQVLSPAFNKNIRGIPSKCPLCKEDFKSASKLRMHLQAKHEGQRAYECEQCAKKFRLPEVYGRHVSTVHKKEKKYHCKRCKKRFAHASALKDHINSHHLKRLFVCGRCKKAYKQKYTHKQHIKKHNH